ncbi:hypothetical protein Tco_0930893, partial [Tanacetum coccineum]
MSCSFNLHTLCSPTNKYYSYNKSQALAFKSQSIPFKPLLKPRLLTVQSRKKFSSRIYAAQSGFFKGFHPTILEIINGRKKDFSKIKEVKIVGVGVGSYGYLRALRNFLGTRIKILNHCHSRFHHEGVGLLSCCLVGIIYEALQTAYKVGKDGIEAGTSLVPESIPRPIARISVAVIGSTVVLFLLKSFLSTAFFVL